jgi:MtN3 and saliva related transmembrane protein
VRRQNNDKGAGMDPLIVNLVGGGAATLTTICWLPQALKILRTRDTAAISLVTYSAFGLGLALWLCYGLLLGSWPIIGSNAVTLVLVFSIIGLKLRHG